MICSFDTSNTVFHSFLKSHLQKLFCEPVREGLLDILKSVPFLDISLLRGEEKGGSLNLLPEKAHYKIQGLLSSKENTSLIKTTEDLFFVLCQKLFIEKAEACGVPPSKESLLSDEIANIRQELAFFKNILFGGASVGYVNALKDLQSEKQWVDSVVKSILPALFKNISSIYGASVSSDSLEGESEVVTKPQVSPDLLMDFSLLSETSKSPVAVVSSFLTSLVSGTSIRSYLLVENFFIYLWFKSLSKEFVLPLENIHSWILSELKLFIKETKSRKLRTLQPKIHDLIASDKSPFTLESFWSDFSHTKKVAYDGFLGKQPSSIQHIITEHFEQGIALKDILVPGLEEISLPSASILFFSFFGELTKQYVCDIPYVVTKQPVEEKVKKRRGGSEKEKPPVETKELKRRGRKVGWRKRKTSPEIPIPKSFDADINQYAVSKEDIPNIIVNDFLEFQKILGRKLPDWSETKWRGSVRDTLNVYLDALKFVTASQRIKFREKLYYKFPLTGPSPRPATYTSFLKDLYACLGKNGEIISPNESNVSMKKKKKLISRPPLSTNKPPVDHVDVYSGKLENFDHKDFVNRRLKVLYNISGSKIFLVTEESWEKDKNNIIKTWQSFFADRPINIYESNNGILLNTASKFRRECRLDFACLDWFRDCLGKLENIISHKPHEVHEPTNLREKNTEE